MEGVLGLKPLGWLMVKYSIKCYFSNFININANNQIETNTLKGPPYVAEFVQSKVSNTFLYSLITFFSYDASRLTSCLCYSCYIRRIH